MKHGAIKICFYQLDSRWYRCANQISI